MLASLLFFGAVAVSGIKYAYRNSKDLSKPFSSTNKGEPIVLDEKSISGKAFRNIAERIVDENVPLLEINGESNGIFAKLMKIFKKN